MAELPLPQEMQRLEQIFQALNAVHSFLLSAHIQVGRLHVPQQHSSLGGVLYKAGSAGMIT